MRTGKLLLLTFILFFLETSLALREQKSCCSFAVNASILKLKLFDHLLKIKKFHPTSSETVVVEPGTNTRRFRWENLQVEKVLWAIKTRKWWVCMSIYITVPTGTRKYHYHCRYQFYLLFLIKTKLIEVGLCETGFKCFRF